jgi:L-lactate dehydrogenase complex protein LldG
VVDDARREQAMSSPLGTDGAAFLRRVSAALGRSATPSDVPPAPAVEDSVARTVGPGQNLPALFAQRAAAVGMTVHRVAPGAARGRIVELLRSLGARRVAVGATLADVAAALTGAGFETVDWRGAPGLEPLYTVDVGITDVQAAIAETGSLVCWSGPGRGRGLSLVPPVHIAIVRPPDIVPDLIDYWANTGAGANLPSSLVLITGPSKTADIEGELITGVHGPREVHIVQIDDA